MRIRKLHWSHKVLGLSLALLLMLQGATGAAVAFREPLLTALNRQLLTAPGRVLAPPVDRVLAEAERHYGARIERVVFPRGIRTAVMIYLTGAQGSQRVIAADPASGSITGEITGAGLLPFILFRVHDELLLGRAGHAIGVLEAAGLLYLCVSGLVLGRAWQPSAWRVRWRAGRLARRYDLHRVTGSAFAMLLVFSAVTGLILQAEALVASGAASDGARARPDWSYLMPQVTDLLRTYGPETIEDIRISPELKQAAIAFYAHDTTRPLALDRITLDLTSGQVAGRQRARDESNTTGFLAWMYVLHSGKAFGPAGVAVSVAGVGLVALPLLGFLLWLARAPTRRPARRQSACRSSTSVRAD
ncbi:MAG: PepSY domain-containing protein [Proteobacteria bacterium]|nr:PepSY domain-containing protein [Pseudomonadota bacterium]